jgi:hypothetical protein
MVLFWPPGATDRCTFVDQIVAWSVKGSLFVCSGVACLVLVVVN